jgi:hypothetical protein
MDPPSKKSKASTQVDAPLPGQDECGICCEQRCFLSMVDFKCGHGMCDTCFDRFIRVDGYLSCPQCRTPIHEETDIYVHNDPKHLTPIRVKEALGKPAGCKAHPQLAAPLGCRQCPETFCSECIPNHAHGGVADENCQLVRIAIREGLEPVEKFAEEAEDVFRDMKGRIPENMVWNYFEKAKATICDHLNHKRKEFTASYRSKSGITLEESSRDFRKATMGVNRGIRKAHNLLHFSKTLPSIAHHSHLAVSLPPMRKELERCKALKPRLDFTEVKEALDAHPDCSPRLIMERVMQPPPLRVPRPIANPFIAPQKVLTIDLFPPSGSSQGRAPAAAPEQSARVNLDQLFTANRSSQPRPIAPAPGNPGGAIKK